jgi:hypothetical protein
MSMKEDDAPESRRATECMEVELKERHTSKAEDDRVARGCDEI